MDPTSIPLDIAEVPALPIVERALSSGKQRRTRTSRQACIQFDDRSIDLSKLKAAIVHKEQVKVDRLSAIIPAAMVA